MRASVFFGIGSVATLTLCFPLQAVAGEEKEPSIDGVPMSTWLVRLNEPKSEVRLQAAKALARISPKSGKPVDALVEKALNDSDPHVRAYSAVALRRMDSSNDKALARIADQLNSVKLIGGEPDEASRREAVEAAARIGPAAHRLAPALIRKLPEGGFFGLGVAAGDALENIGPPPPEAIPELMKLLEDKDAVVRGAATTAIGRVSPPDKRAVPTLIAALKDPDSGVRAKAVWALKVLKPAPKDVLPQITQLLNNPDWSIRHVGAELLGEFGVGSGEAIKHLTASLKDEDGSVQIASAVALLRVDPETKLSVPALRKALGSKRPGVRRYAASILGGMGKQAKESLSEIKKLATDDDDMFVRIGAATAWAKIDPADGEAASALVAIFKNPDLPRPDLAEYAIDALGEIGSSAAESVPDLCALLGGNDESKPVAAINALGRIKPLTKQAEKALLGTLEGKNTYIARHGARALLSHDLANKAALAAMIRFLDDKSPSIRTQAARDLAELNLLSKVNVQQLMLLSGPARLLSDLREDFVREDATTALGELGPNAKAAVPILLDRLIDLDPRVRRAAEKALKKIDPEAATKAGVP